MTKPRSRRFIPNASAKQSEWVLLLKRIGVNGLRDTLNVTQFVSLYEYIQIQIFPLDVLLGFSDKISYILFLIVYIAFLLKSDRYVYIPCLIHIVLSFTRLLQRTNSNFKKMSTTKPTKCSSLRQSGHVMIKGRPCKIVEMSTSKTGKHGHAKVNPSLYLF